VGVGERGRIHAALASGPTDFRFGLVEIYLPHYIMDAPAGPYIRRENESERDQANHGAMNQNR
jgi:hypothetical protein